MSNPSYRPEGVRVERDYRINGEPYTFTEYLTGYTDDELTAMDTAVEKIKEESAAKDAEIARLTKRAEFFRSQTEVVERQRPLCPDHRDKQRGKECLACDLEEAEAEAEKWEARAEEAWKHANRSGAEIARLKKDIERMTLCPPYDPCRNDNCMDEKEAAEQRIRELEEEAAKYKALWNGPALAAMKMVKEARAAMKEEAAKVVEPVHGHIAGYWLRMAAKQIRALKEECPRCEGTKSITPADAFGREYPGQEPCPECNEEE